jgi:hypothetical protein
VVYTVDVYVIKEDLTKQPANGKAKEEALSGMLSYLACKDSIAASVNFNLWQKIWAPSFC